MFYPGLPADMIEKIRTDDTVEVWTQDGDTYSCTVKSKVWPEKTYKFKFGEETTDTDPFGGGVKVFFFHLIKRGKRRIARFTSIILQKNIPKNPVFKSTLFFYMFINI